MELKFKKVVEVEEETTATLLDLLNIKDSATNDDVTAYKGEVKIEITYFSGYKDIAIYKTYNPDWGIRFETGNGFSNKTIAKLIELAIKEEQYGR